MLMNEKLQIGKGGQKTMLTGYRHFGTTYQSHLQEDLIYTTEKAWNHAWKIFSLTIMEERGLKVS